MPRGATLGAAAAVALLACGCAVGRLIVGAPAPGARAPAAAPALQQTPGAAPSGRAVLARRCDGCHEAPDPAGMSGADWRAALERMKRRMRLPAGEWDSLAAMRTRVDHAGGD